MDPVELLHPGIQRWVWQQGWPALRQIQAQAIPLVLGRQNDVVISAPTAGGKTEAAFLPIMIVPFEAMMPPATQTPTSQRLPINPTIGIMLPDTNCAFQLFWYSSLLLCSNSSMEAFS